MLVLALLLQTAPPSYWQQRVSYDIAASLDETAGTLSGEQRVVYRNNSPDTLRTLSFHLYLNAFRPGSRWADADSAERRRRFNDLKDPDFGMNRVWNVQIMGRDVTPVYPFAPDSTIVRFALPAPLAPGDSLTAAMQWLARPSTVPRRQGRRGRAFDFAQWYPRVVAYDRNGWQEHPLYPAGEFYGEFGDFTVALDLPVDQVVGATGVPLCGDPGWAGANRNPARPVEYRRDFYPAAANSLPGGACDARGPGRKTIVWRAEDVHHFALSMRPDYRYEGGRFGNVSVHVLYQPGDEASWGGGVAVGRTETALRWLDQTFGAYPWPQMTNVHRIEGGGTEFPMMMHNGSAGQELILHEGGHNYLMGILANNEWKEGFLDEGFTSFQTTLWAEANQGHGKDPDFLRYANLERDILELDLDGWSEPTSYPSEKYRDFVTYNEMIYSRGELFYHQLRAIVGPETMAKILRTYYDRWKLKHVDEDAFRHVAEEVSGKDLSVFFAQWLHGVNRYGYAVGRIETRRRPGTDIWVGRVEVIRTEPGVFPVEVVVRSKGDSAKTAVDGLAERRWVEFTTRGKPREVVIDPRVVSHDWNMLDNRKSRGWFGWGRGQPSRHSIDRIFSTPSYRDREAIQWLPTVWTNDAADAVVGLRIRSNYLGRYGKYTGFYGLATKGCCSDQSRRYTQWAIRLENPTFLASPRLSTMAEAYRLEGREGAAIGFERRRKGHLGFGPATWTGLSLRWLATSDMAYLDPALYDNGGTVEATATIRSEDRRGPWRLAGAMALGGGVEYRNRGAGSATADRYDTQSYVRVFGSATARRAWGNRGSVAFRVAGGVVAGGDHHEPMRQRWFYLAGADPYQQFGNPFVRSAGALLTGDVHFQTPGGAGVRGLERDVAVTQMAAVNAEIDRSVLRPSGKLVRDVRLALFGDWAVTDGFFSLWDKGKFAYDAGAGVRFTHTIGQTTFSTRFDVPVFVSHPDRAVGGARSDDRVRFRWVVAVGPAF